MHMTGFLHPHHLCQLRNQHEPEFEEPIGPHRKIKKAKVLQQFLTILWVMSSGKKQYLVLWCAYSGGQVKIRVCL